ncbi:MAG: ABC transporter permease [Candidatus Lokiarchaeota archaeon]|nr:ABC transporter permease [Candidatus Lokiarchaeota archaeon]
MSLDFAIKDFYRKKKQTYPYLFTIALMIALATFLIHFSISFNLNSFTDKTGDYLNSYFFSGVINIIYSQFNMIILIMIIIFIIVILSLIFSSFINSKKKDISIMKALGTLPQMLYSFYLVESLILFIIGYILGYIFGMIFYLIVVVSIDFLNISTFLFFDVIFTPVLFFVCLICVYIISGLKLKKIGKKNIIKTFSEDIKQDYESIYRLKRIPRWISSFGLNLKYAISNILRKKNRLYHYFITFSIISLLIFTLSLSSIVLNNTSKTWINHSQNENIIVIGHKDVVGNYSLMYEMYSNPNVLVDTNDINFTDENYLFNWSQINDIENIPEIEKIDQRLISFCDIKEKSITILIPPSEENPVGGYQTIGKDREGNFPIIGINSSNIIQNFEIEGSFFDESDANVNLTISDGLAYNYFDAPLIQKMNFPNLGEQFGIKGVVIDSFYSGHTAYIDIDKFRDMLNVSDNQINLLLLKTNSSCYNDIKEELDLILANNLGSNFISKDLNNVFNENLNFIDKLGIYNLIIIIFVFIVFVFSLFDLQKGDLTEKLKDLTIMRAIGSKIKNIRRILFIEGIIALIPSILTSFAGGMILTSLFLTDRIYLPSINIPLILIGFIFILFIILNYIVIIPLTKNIKKLSFRVATLF